MHLIIKVNGEDIPITHDTCKVYRFRNLPELDHAYFDDDSRQFYMFNSWALMDIMEGNGCQTIIDDYPSDNDYDAYIRCTTDHLDEELESLDGDL